MTMTSRPLSGRQISITSLQTSTAYSTSVPWKDSGEYWNGEEAWEDTFDPNGADHAIEVIGFDPETNCVIVNDSGNPEGRGTEIPLETFLNAWADSGNAMVEVPGVRQNSDA